MILLTYLLMCACNINQVLLRRDIDAFYFYSLDRFSSLLKKKYRKMPSVVTVPTIITVCSDAVLFSSILLPGLPSLNTCCAIIT